MALRKLCISKGCEGLSKICEHAQARDQTCDLVDLWRNPNNNTSGGGCQYYLVRKELGGGDRYTDPIGSLNMPKFGKGPNQSQAAKARELGLTPPDLNVTRHIKDGRNIKGDN